MANRRIVALASPIVVPDHDRLKLMGTQVAISLILVAIQVGVIHGGEESPGDGRLLLDLDSPDVDVAGRAACELARRTAWHALPKLLERSVPEPGAWGTLRNSQVLQALDDLLSLDPVRGAGELASLAKSTDHRVQCGAASFLIGTAHLDPACGPALMGLLDGDNQRAKVLACYSLWGLGVDPSILVPHLVKALAGIDAGSEAKMLLSRIGGSSSEAVAALVDRARQSPEQLDLTLCGLGLEGARGLARLLQTPASDVRRNALYCLIRMGPEGWTATQDVVTVLRDTDPKLRADAANALSWIGPGAHGALAALSETLNDPEEQVRVWAARAIRFIGPNGIEVPLQLLSSIRTGTPRARGVAAGALGSFCPEASGALGTLLEALEDPEEEVRAGAARAFVLWMPSLRVVQEALERRLSDESLLVRLWVQGALFAQWPADDDDHSIALTFKALRRKLPNQDLFYEALDLLECLRDRALFVVPLLLKLAFEASEHESCWIRGNDLDLSDCVFRLVAQIGCTPILLGRLADELRRPHPLTFAKACAAIEYLGPLAASLEPELEALLGHSDPDYRKSAAAIIACIGTAAQRAVPPLRKLLLDKNRKVRWRACQTLNSLLGHGFILREWEQRQLRR